jgi:hypothetical protein
VGRRVIGVPQLDQAEVDQYRPAHGRAVGQQDDVIGLDVAVNDLALVAVLQSLQQLPAQTRGVGRGQRPIARHVLGQVLPLHQVHHQESQAVLLEEVGHGDDAGVVQPGQHRRLAAELLVELARLVRVQPRLRRQRLDGHIEAEPVVEGAIDRPHAAAAEVVADGIAPLQDLARCQHDPHAPRNGKPAWPNVGHGGNALFP